MQNAPNVQETLCRAANILLSSPKGLEVSKAACSWPEQTMENSHSESVVPVAKVLGGSGSCHALWLCQPTALGWWSPDLGTMQYPLQADVDEQREQGQQPVCLDFRLVSKMHLNFVNKAFSILFFLHLFYRTCCRWGFLTLLRLASWGNASL